VRVMLNADLEDIRMRRIVVILVVLILSTLSCGLFSGDEGEETPGEIVPTEVVGVLETNEGTDVPEETKLPTVTEQPSAVVTYTPSKIDIPIERKKGDGTQEATPAVTEIPIASTDEGLPDDMEVIYFPYDVAKYERGVEITVSDFRAYKYAYSEDVRFIGTITNTGTVDLYNITVHIFALDENGEELTHAYERAHLVDFPVRVKVGFSMFARGDGFPEGVERLLIAFDGMERWEGTSSTRNFEILSSEGQSKPHDVWGEVYDITVSFRNSNENDVQSVRAAAILYDKFNKLVGLGYGSLDTSFGGGVLPLGEMAEIVFTCTSVYGIVDHFEVAIEGKQIFE
jgi:hypothetical protein